MRRRHFLGAISSLAWTPPMFSASPKGHILELRHYHLRNGSDMQMQRTSEFIEKHAAPAAKRAGSEVAGVFANLIAPGGPFLVMMNRYPSLTAMEAAQSKVGEDKEFNQALEAYYAKPGLGFERIDVTLVRCTDWMPQPDPPPIERGKAPRVFELRVYESNNNATLRKKVKMFEDGEAAIFRRVGIRPVFFGTAMAGVNLPNLTYMVCYDDLAAREKAWKAFLADPEWEKLRSAPGLSDAEIVSNISSSLLRPLAFSPIR